MRDDLTQVERQFAANVAYNRLERGWSINELSERTGITKSVLGNTERGIRHVTLADAITLAMAFEVNLLELLL